MPYDKDGKYYRKPVVPEKTGKSVDDILNNTNRNANIFVSIVLVGIIGSCVAILNQPKEVKMSCTRRVGMDTRKTFDDSKFIVSLDESINGKGTIEDVITGQKQYVIFNDTYRYNLSQQKRNINQPLPKSIEDVEYTRLTDGRVLFFNDCIE